MNLIKIHLKKFKDLNEIYDLLNNFKNSKDQIGSDKCHIVKQCCRKYEDHIKNCGELDNKSFCKALDNFRNEYNDYVKTVTTCDDVPKYLNSPFGNDVDFVMLSPFIIIFIISIIILILYKVNMCLS
ncbi:hypothetical protein PVNG_05526 [Plasmodium vivax North Korean]|uniref:PIR Superfamily Protein n=1 Tax=Plasmodium vivax North Korean TaxID=1035514 RepID=A0A0J9U4X4_PLAVI|nr:hypothetical protein PVNG_05526 [Plasmodium vivax North Korean]